MTSMFPLLTTWVLFAYNTLDPVEAACAFIAMLMLEMLYRRKMGEKNFPLESLPREQAMWFEKLWFQLVTTFRGNT